MAAVWIMIVMFCPGYTDRSECRKEVVPGVFRTEQVCKDRGEMLKAKGVAFRCYASWPNDA